MIRRGGVVSFDNLAVAQLGLRGQLTASAWDRFYMGDDGTHTMYVDAVRNEFAVSSTSPRQARNGRSIREMFSVVRAAAPD